MRCFVQLNPTKIFVIALWLLVFIQITPAQPSNPACEPPKDLKSVVEGKYPGTKIVSLTDLRQEDRELFQKEHSDSCPGLVEVDAAVMRRKGI